MAFQAPNGEIRVHPAGDLSTTAGFLALKSQGTQLAVGGTNPYVLVSTPRGDIRVFDAKEKQTKSLGKHKNLTHMQVSAAGRFAVSVGGSTMQIYSLESGKEITKQTICDSELAGVTVDWLGEDETLVVAGKNMIGFCFEGEDGGFDINYEEAVCHDKVIKLVKCLKDDTLLTIDVDNNAKVWKFTDDGPATLASFTTNEAIVQVEWDLTNSALALRSESGSLMLLNGDFETAKTFDVLCAEESINLDGFDMEDFEIPEELATPPEDVGATKEEKGGKTLEPSLPEKDVSVTHSQVPKFDEAKKFGESVIAAKEPSVPIQSTEPEAIEDQAKLDENLAKGG